MQIEESKIKAAMDAAHKEAGHNAYFGNGFKMGVEFALQQLKGRELSFFEIIDKMEKEGKDIRLFNVITALKTVKKGGLITIGIDEKTIIDLMDDFSPANMEEYKFNALCIVVNREEYQSIENT